MTESASASAWRSMNLNQIVDPNQIQMSVTPETTTNNRDSLTFDSDNVIPQDPRSGQRNQQEQQAANQQQRVGASPPPQIRGQSSVSSHISQNFSDDQNDNDNINQRQSSYQYDRNPQQPVQQQPQSPQAQAQTQQQSLQDSSQVDNKFTLIPFETHEQLKTSAKAADVYGFGSCIFCFAGFCPCIVYPFSWVWACMPCCCAWGAAASYLNIWNTARNLKESLQSESVTNPTNEKELDKISFQKLRRHSALHVEAVKQTLWCSIFITIFGIIFSTMWFVEGFAYQGNQPFSFILVKQAKGLSLSHLSTIDSNKHQQTVIKASQTKLGTSMKVYNPTSSQTQNQQTDSSNSNSNTTSSESSSTLGTYYLPAADFAQRPFLVPSTIMSENILTNVKYHQVGYIHWLDGDMIQQYTDGWLTVQQSENQQSDQITNINNKLGLSTNSESGCFVVPFLKHHAPITIDSCSKTTGIGAIDLGIDNDIESDSNSDSSDSDSSDSESSIEKQSKQNFNKDSLRYKTHWDWSADADEPNRGRLILPIIFSNRGAEEYYYVGLCQPSVANADIVGQFGLTNSYYCINKQNYRGRINYSSSKKSSSSSSSSDSSNSQVPDSSAINDSIEFHFDKVLDTQIELLPLLTGIITLVFFTVIICPFNLAVSAEYYRNQSIQPELAKGERKLLEKLRVAGRDSSQTGVQLNYDIHGNEIITNSNSFGQFGNFSRSLTVNNNLINQVRSLSNQMITLVAGTPINFPTNSANLNLHQQQQIEQETFVGTPIHSPRNNTNDRNRSGQGSGQEQNDVPQQPASNSNDNFDHLQDNNENVVMGQPYTPYRPVGDHQRDLVGNPFRANLVPNSSGGNRATE